MGHIYTRLPPDRCSSNRRPFSSFVSYSDGSRIKVLSHVRVILILLVAVHSHSVRAQDANRFKNFHGIKQPQSKADFFEAEGYDIFVQSVDYALNEKGISRIRKKYSIKGAVLANDSATGLSVLLWKKVEDSVTTYGTYYLFSENEQSSKIIGFVRAGSRDIALETDFVITYLANQIPPFVFTPLEIDTIDFAGRDIRLGPMCRWMSPHNVQCPGEGQMNWAIFNDQEQAELYRDTHVRLTKHKEHYKITEQAWVPVKFEGSETKALRIKAQVRVPKWLIAGGSVLIVYYVTAEVRGRYVTCILSQYEDDVPAGKLTRLLSEVMMLPGSDGTWTSPSSYDGQVPIMSDSVEEEIVQENEDRGLILLEAGVWIPVGHLAEKAGVSPNVNLYYPLIIRPARNFRIDLHMSLFFPLNTEEFKYTTSDTTFMTTLGSGLNVLGLHLTRTKQLRRSRFIDYFDQTYGLGVAFYPTVTEKPKENPDDRSNKYYFDTIHMSYGVVFRKKIFKKSSIGLAVRYNFTPTGWFDTEVGQGFGNSSVTTSLQFKL